MADVDNGARGASGIAEPASLPRRGETPRCAHQEARRRCVLPPGHLLDHVYPHQRAAAT
ncbi:hypothetical protein [Planomonospora venezuelensis]|uniref:Uncharacterized protein n=1 Tax=Planomonospora venezuelensis TaxID=1999 RepID=A0A841D7X3_PLAVE|nr:hypothetical protein [Planomonospora venezuelensis]MBB5966040.1 hypothetical protein [Planomonospora venezuelensis]GIN03648.1 hypothetical protein Pve01_53060 [Planomonospora venezuelensis]